VQGKNFPPQIVEIHGYGLLQLVDFMAEHCMWGSLNSEDMQSSLTFLLLNIMMRSSPARSRKKSFWSELDTIFVEIKKSDEILLEWFELNINRGVVQINAQINDFVGPLQFSPM